MPDLLVHGHAALELLLVLGRQRRGRRRRGRISALAGRLPVGVLGLGLRLPSLPLGPLLLFLGLPGLPLGPLPLVLRLPGLPLGPLLLPLCLPGLPLGPLPLPLRLPGLPVGPLLRPDSPDIGWGAGAQEGQVAAILGRVAILAAPGAHDRARRRHGCGERTAGGTVCGMLLSWPWAGTS